MGSEVGSSGDRGRKRKRQRVSFAAGELLEEVRRLCSVFKNPAPSPAYLHGLSWLVNHFLHGHRSALKRRLGTFVQVMWYFAGNFSPQNISSLCAMFPNGPGGESCRFTDVWRETPGGTCRLLASAWSYDCCACCASICLYCTSPRVC